MVIFYNITLSLCIKCCQAPFFSNSSTKEKETESEYEEALELYRELAKENHKIYGQVCAATLVLGVYYFDEASKMLKPYKDEYLNVKFLSKMI